MFVRPDLKRRSKLITTACRTSLLRAAATRRAIVDRHREPSTRAIPAQILVTSWANAWVMNALMGTSISLKASGTVPRA